MTPPAADYEVEFSLEDRERFRSGELARAWAGQFPQLFDDADLRLALNQPRYHFYEWLVAVWLYENGGYISLVEKYQFKCHTEAYRRFSELTSPQIVGLFASGGPQAPDLLAYPADRPAEWFFVEVKSPTDRVSVTQAELFQRIEALSAKPVRIAKCRLMKKTITQPLTDHHHPFPRTL